MLKHYRIFLILFVFSCFWLPPHHTLAQQGFYLQPYFMYQYVTIANNKDHYSYPNSTPRRSFQYINTYKPAYGIRAIYNFKNAVGFETGLRYSLQGQKYKGDILVDGNTGKPDTTTFTSEIKLNYFQIPLMLNFNSLIANINDEADPFYMSIAMGLQLDFLHKATMDVNPGIDWILYPANTQDQINNFFSGFNVAFAGNVGLNWQLKHGWQLNLTLFGSKTLSDIENEDMKAEGYVFDKSKYPLEYQFPVSVKKEEVSTEVRYKSNNIVYGLMLGISYRLIHK